MRPLYHNSQWFPKTIKGRKHKALTTVLKAQLICPACHPSTACVSPATQGFVLTVPSAGCPFSALAQPTDSLGSGVCWDLPWFFYLKRHTTLSNSVSLYPALLFMILVAIQNLYLYSCRYQIRSQYNRGGWSGMTQSGYLNSSPSSAA